MYKFLLILAIFGPAADLVTAFVYYAGENPEAVFLRIMRDLALLLIAASCFILRKMPSNLRLVMVFYFLLVIAYSVVGVYRDVPAGTVIASAGTLILPYLLFLCGYGCVRNEWQLAGLWKATLLVCLASAVFGMWDIENTWFWIEAVYYPEYLAQIKGVDLGTEPVSGLPWNFYGGLSLDRRAAGLVAAPLAQGSLLALCAVVCCARFLATRHLYYVLFTAIAVMGVWQSGTRAGFLIILIAVVGLIVSDREFLKHGFFRFAVLATVASVSIFLLWEIVYYTVNLLDGSTIGHLNALIRNIQEFDKVLLAGDGIGRQGAIAAQQNAVFIGGGEGAFFTIAYQIGLPGALLFLAFYFGIWFLLRAQDGVSAKLSSYRRGLSWYMVGLTVTFITSEHILSLSGMLNFWFMLGATCSVIFVARRDAVMRQSVNTISRANVQVA